MAAPGTSVWGDVDATRINQVLGNLLHNAAKFSQRGDAVALVLRDFGGQAEITVRDTGAGIDPALLPHVFDAFVQGDRTLARSDGGLGLGLALVKGIVGLHGGTVVAESDGMGRGSAFVIRLPLAPAPASSLPCRRAPAAAPQRRQRVLVVDDNADGANTLAEVVEMLGHAAEVAYDGASALEKARAKSPDLVLCDIGLPGMDGYEVARRLRALGADGMRLVALSGFAKSEDVRRATEAGFDAHIAKPCDAAEIQRLLS
jgi:CheY-like chemotaxis protein/anti-sigma regulatory factor (Ser/Thr protein kinase)